MNAEEMTVSDINDAIYEFTKKHGHMPNALCGNYKHFCRIQDLMSYRGDDGRWRLEPYWTTPLGRIRYRLDAHTEDFYLKCEE